MALITLNNTVVCGVSAAVPKTTEQNLGLSVFANTEDSQKFINATGVERRRIASDEMCTSDLCFAAADKLIDELGWERSDIDCLIFVTQTPDYILPASSCILQERLGLSNECYTLDISLGCSGWVYGMSVIANLISTGCLRKGLLLAGDTTLKINSKIDKTSWPLFGDAGTATAIEYQLAAPPMNFHLATDGSGYQTIIIPDGAYRNQVNEESFTMTQIEDGVTRNRLHAILNGMDVFSFGISKAPQSVNHLLERFEIDREKVDYFIFHQANKFMNEMIRKKLKLTEQQVPYSLRDFGNTSSATIPLTMVTELGNRLRDDKLDMIGCGFGVGLSWGSVHFSTNKICIPELIEL